MIKNLTKQERLILLKQFFKEDIEIKAVLETLTPNQLDNFLNDNISTLVIKAQKLDRLENE
ncbi:MAG TPA: hypothetical protein VGB37_15515 [Candidatus Lokiarchaeia archaeon]